MKIWKKEKTVFWGLREKIVAFSLTLIAVPLLFISLMTYTRTNEMITEKTSAFVCSAVDQTAINLEFIFGYVRDTSLFLIQDESVRDFLKMDPDASSIEVYQKSGEVQKVALYLLSSKEFIDSFYVEGFNGQEINTKSQPVEISEDLRQEIMSLRGGYLWHCEYQDGTSAPSLLRVMNDTVSLTNRLALMQINISEKRLRDICQNSIQYEGERYYVVDNEDRIISAADPSVLGDTIDPVMQGFRIGKSAESHTIELDGKQYLFTACRMDHTDWTLMHLVPMDELLDESRNFLSFLATIISALLCLSVIVIFVFTKRMLGDLAHIRRFVRSLENGNLSSLIFIESNDEIGLVADALNNLLYKLNISINEVYVGKIKQREAELRALQSQVHPHFLYNTLDMIYWNARLEKATETSDLIQALSKLFRLSLSSAGECFLIRDEVNYIRCYLKIQQKRYRDSIHFEVCVEDGLEDYLTLKMVLQPLVENAIYHGIEPAGGSGNIVIRLYSEGETIIFCVEDDGAGIDLAEAEKLLEHPAEGRKGFAINNVQERIKLYFGDRYGIRFYHREGGGTRVIVCQPKQRQGERKDV